MRHAPQGIQHEFDTKLRRSIIVALHESGKGLYIYGQKGIYQFANIEPALGLIANAEEGGVQEEQKQSYPADP
ncbi:MAG TPA: hypothetical protein VFI72_15290 [Candidatus Angelobacter sp.]|nr:hypothetical protein [Candidatus Angelobacter sp.]